MYFNKRIFLQFKYVFYIIKLMILTFVFNKNTIFIILTIILV